MICGSCVKELPLVSMPKCVKCGKPVPKEEEMCFDCTKIQHCFTEGMGIFLYEEIMRKSMHHFKYLGRKEYGSFYGMAAWVYGRNTLELWSPQAIIPIPIHKSKLRARGYNQAEVIADVLGSYMGVPVLKNLLYRQTKTTAQKELTLEERRQNLEGAFAVSDAYIHMAYGLKKKKLKRIKQQMVSNKRAIPSGKIQKRVIYDRILLVDDIYTTGSTMDSAANELKKCGIKEIYALSICIGKGFVIQ